MYCTVSLFLCERECGSCMWKCECVYLPSSEDICVCDMEVKGTSRKRAQICLTIVHHQQPKENHMKRWRVKPGVTDGKLVCFLAPLGEQAKPNVHSNLQSCSRVMFQFRCLESIKADSLSMRLPVAAFFSLGLYGGNCGNFPEELWCRLNTWPMSSRENTKTKDYGYKGTVCLQTTSHLDD